jgi:hypothetical protein
LGLGGSENQQVGAAAGFLRATSKAPETRERLLAQNHGEPLTAGLTGPPVVLEAQYFPFVLGRQQFYPV